MPRAKRSAPRLQTRSAQTPDANCDESSEGSPIVAWRPSRALIVRHYAPDLARQAQALRLILQAPSPIGERRHAP